MAARGDLAARHAAPNLTHNDTNVFAASWTCSGSAPSSVRRHWPMKIWTEAGSESGSESDYSYSDEEGKEIEKEGWRGDEDQDSDEESVEIEFEEDEDEASRGCDWLRSRRARVPTRARARGCPPSELRKDTASCLRSSPVKAVSLFHTAPRRQQTAARSGR